MTWQHSRTRGRFPGRRYVPGDPLVRAERPVRPAGEALTAQKLRLLRLLRDSAEPPSAREIADHLGVIEPFALETLAELATEMGFIVFGEGGVPILTPLGRAAALNPGEAA